VPLLYTGVKMLAVGSLVYQVQSPEVPKPPPVTVRSTLSPWQIVVFVAVIPLGAVVGVSIVTIWLTVFVVSQFPSALRNTFVVDVAVNKNGSPVPSNVPPKLGSPLYQAQLAPVPRVPPEAYKVTEPDPQIEVGLATIDDAVVEG